MFKKSQKGTGALLDTRPPEEKQKDFLWKEIVANAEPVNWQEKSQWRKFPIYDQNGSSSCVAFSLAKILGIMHQVNEGEWIDFSPGFIYQQRSNKPSAGMAGIDAWEIVRKNGALLESFFPSQGKDDHYFDTYPVKNYEKEIASVFKISNYVILPTKDIDTIASTIQKTNKGVMVWYYWTYDEWDRDLPIIRNYNLDIVQAAKHSVCFTPSVMVLTKNGFKEIKDIKIGEEVLTHLGRFKRVKNVFKRKYNGEIIVFKSRISLGEIGCTPEHPILKREINIKTQHTKNTINQGLDKFKFEDAETITKNSVFVNQIFPTQKINLTKERAYLLGAYIGDGNLHQDKIAVRFALGGTKKEENLQQKLIQFMFKEFGVFPHYYKVKNSNSFQLIFRSKNAWKFFEDWSGCPNNKSIKSDLFFADKETLYSFLMGLIDTDGSFGQYKSGSKYYSIFTSEKKLAYGISIILNKLELNYSYTITKPHITTIKGKDWKCKGGYDFRISINNKNDFIKYKNGKQFVRINKKYPYKKKYGGLVYNLEVEEDNTYIVDNVIVHNCAVDYILTNGKKCLIIDDSWDKRGINGQRIITEDFHSKRNFFAAYPINFKFEELCMPKPSYTFNKDLSYGMNNNDVKMLQCCLKFEGLFPVNTECTGSFYGLTLSAVKQFQAKYGIPQTGYVGQITRAKLNELF